MKPQQTITSLPVSPDDDRHRRMVQYSVAMGIRLLCVVACFLVHGWWLVIPALGAIFLPSVAVLLANNVGATRATRAEDRKSTRLNSSHSQQSRMPSSA